MKVRLVAVVRRAVPLRRYVPDSSAKRALTFLLLFVYHGALGIAKTLSMTLLAQVNWIWLVAYTVVDHAAFQLYKLARSDLAYWIPGFGLPFSSFVRSCIKVLVDFTGTFSGLSRRAHRRTSRAHGCSCTAWQAWSTFATRSSSAAPTSCLIA